MPFRGAVRYVALAALLASPASAVALAADRDQVARGEYLAVAASCVTCHTADDGQRLAGGRAFATPFGTFYSPNITPDQETGIGRWTDAEFLRALRRGERPDGAHYFPVFPYTSFTGITDEDALAIKAYLFSQPPVRQAEREHDVSFPFSWRFLQTAWKLLFFEPGPFRPTPERSAEHNRGAYLVTAIVHCGECHTPRNWFGATDPDSFLAGAPDPGGGRKAPNITPDPKTGIGNWSEDDIVQMLTDGQTPNFDEVGGSMAAVVRNTARLTQEDRRAIAVYLKSVPAVSTPEQK